MEKMTEAEQEAFDKWMNLQWGDDYKEELSRYTIEHSRRHFLAGYRAGFSAQHYDVEVRPVAVDELVAALEWYRVQAEGCAKITKDGDIGRNNLSFDAGKRACAALAKHRGKA